MPDIYYHLRPGLNTCPWWTAKCAVLGSIFGSVNTFQAERYTSKLIELWRNRLQDLIAAGWEVPRAKLQHYRNCRPTFAVVENPIGMACHLWFCPFCWGRRVVEVYEKLAPHVCDDAGVHRWVSRYRIIRVKDSPLVENPAQIPCDLAASAGRRRQSYFKATRAKGMFSMSTVEPIEKPQGWKLVQRQFFKLGMRQDVPEQRGGLIRIDLEVTRKRLTRILARLLRYPASWMRCKPTVMVTAIYGRMARRNRMMEFIGDFK